MPWEENNEKQRRRGRRKRRRKIERGGHDQRNRACEWKRRSRSRLAASKQVPRSLDARVHLKCELEGGGKGEERKLTVIINEDEVYSTHITPVAAHFSDEREVCEVWGSLIDQVDYRITTRTEGEFMFSLPINPDYFRGSFFLYPMISHLNNVVFFPSRSHLTIEWIRIVCITLKLLQLEPRDWVETRYNLLSTNRETWRKKEHLPLFASSKDIDELHSFLLQWTVHTITHLLSSTNATKHVQRPLPTYFWRGSRRPGMWLLLSLFFSFSPPH